MRVEFPQGVPQGCTAWLNEHVGKGNITGFVDDDDYAWFYRRERVWPQGHEAFEGVDRAPKYVPTITVKDPQMAAWFALRWAS